MGHSSNDALVISINGYAWDNGHQAGEVGVDRATFEQWRASLEPEWQALIVGPIRHVINDGWSIAMLPDGSKDGWADDEEGDRIRSELVEMFSFDYGHPSDSPFSVVQVAWNFDPHGPPQAFDPREDTEE